MQVINFVLALFNRSVFNGMQFNFKMDPEKADGYLWVPSATVEGGSVKLPFRVERRNGLKAREWILVLSVRRELAKLDVDVTKVRLVEFNHLPGVVYSLNDDSSSEKLNIPL